MKAVVLLSGGMDSATCLAQALREGREVFTLTFSTASGTGWRWRRRRPSPATSGWGKKTAGWWI